MRQMAIVIFTIIWLTPSLVFAETKDGFRDMRWGDAPTADFKREESETSKKSILGSSEAVRYKRSSDKLTIGKVGLSSITYYFEDNKLCEVDVNVDYRASTAEWRMIVDALKLAYGAPEISEVQPGEGGISRWKEGNTIIFLSYLESKLDADGQLHSRITVAPHLMIIDKAYAERVSRDNAAKEQREKSRDANAGRDDL